MLRCAGFAVLIGFLALSVACGGGNAAIDLGNLATLSGDTPRITALTFVGQAPKASDFLIFEITFDDSTGDLSAGKLLTFINDGAPLVDDNLKLQFLQNDLDPKAKKGVLRVTTQIAFLSPAASDGRSSLDIAFQLIDAKGHESNRAKASFVVEF